MRQREETMAYDLYGDRSMTMLWGVVLSMFVTRRLESSIPRSASSPSSPSITAMVREDDAPAVQTAPLLPSSQTSGYVFAQCLSVRFWDLG